jgi:prolyl oligopeptidase
MRRERIFIPFATILAVLILIIVTMGADKPSEIRGGNGIILPPPPPTEAKPVTDEVAGHTITDPYRWLEDSKSAETRAWISSQMQYTEDYLKQIKIRPEIVKRLTELEKVETFGLPHERQGNYFFMKRLPDENQASIYFRHGLDAADERLIDANTLSSDQNTSVHIEDISENGTLLVYGVQEGGADEQSIRLFDVTNRKDLPDTLPKARYFGVNLSPDNQGLYYSKVEPATGSKVYYHRFKTPTADDQLLFGESFNGDTFGPMDLISSEVTENGRYLLITVGHGVPFTRVDIYAKDLRKPDSPIRAMVHGIDSRFYPNNQDDSLYILTDYQAPNYRVIRVDMNDPASDHWQTVVPEGKDVISQTTIVGGKLFVTGLHDVITETTVYELSGKETRKVTYPAIGSASAMIGRHNSQQAFYTFESFNIPPTIYHYNVLTGKTNIFAASKVPFTSDKYEVRQVFYKSKDGTSVPMFISSRKGLKRDGSAPALLWAYGGFNVSLTPTWNPEYAWWIEQGGFYAQPNLRGGGEYGENWHKAGMFEKKQNVFDDFYAAAEYLIDNHYTTAEHLAIRGRSNGGLLMGAAMTQRPDLFGAIWCGYPLLDMIRFQKFLVGKWWTTEYGSSDNPDQFAYLIKYSPYQNVKPGTRYPAIMFNTGDSDTRVDPLHARKMTALMQADTGSDRPILLHYETQAGHSSGVSIRQQVQDTADELAFLWNETGGS